MTQVLVRVADYALAVGVNVIFSGARSFRKWLFCMVVLSPAFSACAPSYSAKAITTRVVDADTKEPLEGVIVVADWQLEGGGSEGGIPGQLMFLESSTDRSGTFHFAAWGPKKVRIGALGNRDPDILLVKGGYQFKLAQNPFRTVADKMPTGTRDSIYDGKVIEMHRFQGDLRQWSQQLDQVGDIASLMTVGHCEWRHVPRLLNWFKKQSEALQNAHILHGGAFYYSFASHELEIARQGCGSFSDFMSEHAE